MKEKSVFKQKQVRNEMFNIKNEASQKIFKSLTSETTEFSNCFEGKANLKEKIEKWRQVLKTFCNQSFKKIRIKQSRTKQISSKLQALINQRNDLMKEKKSRKITFQMEDKFNCDNCEYENESKGKLQKHNKSEHIVAMNIKCEECDKTFKIESEPSKQSIREHRTIEQLENEINDVNKIIAEEEANENREKILKHFNDFSCQIIGKKY